MKISSFIDAHKCLELAKRYSDNVPKMVDEMMTRLDDFVRSEEAFASTKLPKGKVPEIPRKSTRLVSRREDQFHRGGFNLSSLTKLPKEILASEPQLNLQLPRPMQLPPKNYDYHGEKGHYTNDCFSLRRQLEIALESKKLNHLIKDIRQRGRRNTKGKNTGKDKVINMIRSWPDDRKRNFLYNTLHDKYPTPRGIATLVTQAMIIFECRRLEKKQMVEKEVNRNVHQEKEVPERVDLTEQTLVNQSHPNQLCRKSVLRNEEGHSRATVINHHSKGRNIVRIRGGRECGNSNREKEKTMSNTLRDYERKAHPIKVIMDQPLKHILNKAQASRKLAKSSGGNSCRRILLTTSQGQNKYDVKKWTLFTNGASNSKGFRDGLVLISPSSVEFTYALRLSFTSTNNKAEYEALLARLRMARKIKVQDIDVRVDLKLGKKQMVEKEVNRNVHQEEEVSERVDLTEQTLVNQSHPNQLVQMAQDDEEKTAIYMDQGTYSYTKMPFGLKNAWATYQRLVDTAFQSQIGRNLEA
nr:hypothetical protein [Tanacetum cinerariifolium]